MAQIPSSRGNPQASDLAVQSALPMVGSLSREDLQTTLNLIDAQIAKLFEDRSVLLIGGGTVTVAGGAASATFTEDLKLHFNSLVAGGAPKVITVRTSAQTMSLATDGDMAYVVVNRTAPSLTYTDNSSTLPAVTSANQEVFLIAKRVGTRIYFRNGTVLEQSQSSSLDSTIASGIDVDAVLPLIGSAADDTLMEVLTSLDSDLALLYSNENILLADGGEIQFTGTSLILAQALKLHINSKVPGGAPVIKTMVAGTYSLASNGDMLYVSIDNRTANTTIGISSASTLPAVTDADTEIFLLAKRIDGADTTKRLYFRNGTMLAEGDSAYLGSSGGGSAGYARIFLNQ